MNASRWSRLRVSAGLLAAMITLSAVGLQAAGHASDRPNIVLILTDDQRVDQLAWMPSLSSELAQKGLTIDRFYVNDPLCCPSRATLLTGTYNHTNRVYGVGNEKPYGGWYAFKPSEDRTIAVALHDAGYRTGLVGKYMNDYNDPSYVPPGWDRWVADVYLDVYENQPLAVDGQFVSTTGYGTDLLADHAEEFVRTAPGDQPLFLYFAPHAPHAPATPPERYKGAFDDVPFPRYPSFNETDLGDKPQYVQRQPMLTTAQQRDLVALWRKQLGSLAAVDDAIARIVHALSDTGRLSNTMIVFTSDNGLMLGEHRFSKVKELPYEESVHQPLIVRWDGHVPQAGVDASHVVGAVDLASTWAEAAGASLPTSEGTSIVPLLEGRTVPWRDAMLIEHGPPSFGPFCQVHTGRLVYVSYKTGEEELYDLPADPYELTNVAADPAYADELLYLRARKDQLCVPRPPGYPPR